jgi:hypothetical protein
LKTPGYRQWSRTGPEILRNFISDLLLIESGRSVGQGGFQAFGRRRAALRHVFAAAASTS